MTDPTYPLFPVLAFFGFIVVFLPLPWNLRAWNSGTCFFMLWTGLACLNEFVNAVVWAGNTFNPAPVWCDISKLRISLFPYFFKANIIYTSHETHDRSFSRDSCLFAVHQSPLVHDSSCTDSERKPPSGTLICHPYGHRLIFLMQNKKSIIIIIDSLICVVFPLIVVALCP